MDRHEIPAERLPADLPDAIARGDEEVVAINGRTFAPTPLEEPQRHAASCIDRAAWEAHWAQLPPGLNGVEEVLRARREDWG